MLRLLIPAATCLALACALATPRATPERGGVWGQLRLVPHEGVQGAPIAGSSEGYGDRRYSHARRVDYSRPGFAVVYLDGAATAPRHPSTVRIRSGLGGVHLEPAFAALGAGAPLRVVNETNRARALSAPEVGLLRTVAAGESVEVETAGAGELTLFVPGEQGARTRLFRSPGPFVVVDASGRYEILDVLPGSYALRAWHPRFPPSVQHVELSAGVVDRVDVALGVGLDASDEP